MGVFVDFFWVSFIESFRVFSDELSSGDPSCDVENCAVS